MPSLSKTEILNAAIKQLNAAILLKTENQKPKASAVFTIPAPPLGIFVQFHGFFKKYLTKESQKILDFEHNPGTAVCFHNHDYFEMTYLFSGSTTHHMLNHAFCQKPDTLILMNSFVVHGPVPDNDDTIMFNICIRKEIFESFFSTMPPFNQNFYRFFLDSLYEAQKKNMYLDLKITSDIHEILLEMLSEFYQNTLCCQQKLYALFIILFSRFARQQAKAASVLLPSEPSIEQILEKIKKNHASITLEQLSKLSSYSTYHLSRLIKKQTGLCFREYLNSCKMDYAVNYLVHSDFPIEKVCELAGYSSSGYFYRKFRAVYGCTPLQYRQKHILFKEKIND